jgi:putative transposase
MPNHWHFIVKPTTDLQVSEFFQRLTTRHSMRWLAQNEAGGTGHLYQGRFRSFPVQNNEYFFKTCQITGASKSLPERQTSSTASLGETRLQDSPVIWLLLNVMRYVERNPLRANSVERAEDWMWSLAHARLLVPSERRWLSIPTKPALPSDWRTWVNTPETEAEVEALRNSVRKGTPFGNDRWVRSSVVRLGLETTLRPRGRPKKQA